MEYIYLWTRLAFTVDGIFLLIGKVSWSKSGDLYAVEINKFEMVIFNSYINIKVNYKYIKIIIEVRKRRENKNWRNTIVLFSRARKIFNLSVVLMQRLNAYRVKEFIKTFNNDTYIRVCKYLGVYIQPSGELNEIHFELKYYYRVHFNYSGRVENMVVMEPNNHYNTIRQMRWNDGNIEGIKTPKFESVINYNYTYVSIKRNHETITLSCSHNKGLKYTKRFEVDLENPKKLFNIYQCKDLADSYL